MGENEFFIHLHHEDGLSYRKKFSSDVIILCNGIPINPFLQPKLMSINNSHIFPDVAINTLKKMEDIGEKQVTDFFNDRMIRQKVSICEPIPKNDFKVWYAHDVETGGPFILSHSEITKMRSVSEHRPDIAETIFGSEILNVPLSLCKDSETMYHRAKS